MSLVAMGGAIAYPFLTLLSIKCQEAGRRGEKVGGRSGEGGEKVGRKGRGEGVSGGGARRGMSGGGGGEQEER